LGDLAPEVTLYYKHICKRISFEESNEPTTEDEAMMKMQDNLEQLAEVVSGSNGTLKESDLPSDLLPRDKSKLH